MTKKETIVPNVKTLSIEEKLVNIQSELNIPRTQYNAFAKFYYRSCEDILEGIKPIIKSHRAVLVITDEVVMIGTRFYVKTTATLKNLDKNEQISVTAYAREEEVKKGMDGSQITGSSSSYARKYALSGLFGIDDAKDSDDTNKGETPKKVVSKEKLLTDVEMKALSPFITRITNAKTIEELEVIGKEIKAKKFSVSQSAVLRESWGAKSNKLTFSKK